MDRLTLPIFEQDFDDNGSSTSTGIGYTISTCSIGEDIGPTRVPRPVLPTGSDAVPAHEHQVKLE